MDRPLRGLPGRGGASGSDAERRVPSLPFRRELLTRDPVMRRVLETARSVAESHVPVLIEGESGTGKELVARLVHACSPRRARPFVTVDCAATPHEVLDRELFGHQRDASSGALGRTLGALELADGGTLLLDEIDGMDMRLQGKLLRVLEEWAIDPVGGTTAVPVDVRIVATTHRRLGDLVERGRFRQDLFYRLMVAPLALPPLRARRADVGLLARYFLERVRGDRPLGLSTASLAALEARPWPGNVRELEHVIERAVLLARGPDVQPADLEDAAVSAPCSQPGSLAGFTVRELERRLIFDTLERTADNRTQAARLLGISIRTLRNKLAEYRRTGDLPARLAPRQPEPAR